MLLESLVLSPAQKQMSKNTTAANNESQSFPETPMWFLFLSGLLCEAHDQSWETYKEIEEQERKAYSESPATQRQLCKIALRHESLQLVTGSKADVQNVSTGIAFLCFHLWDNIHAPKLIYSAITVLYHTDSPDMLKRLEVSDKDSILVKTNGSSRIKARHFSRTL